MKKKHFYFNIKIIIKKTMFFIIKKLIKIQFLFVLSRINNNNKKATQTQTPWNMLNALREVQAVNVHNIPHYIHVISECTLSDTVSNLCDRFRWTLVMGALRGDSSLGVTQEACTRSPAGRKERCSVQSCCLSSPPTLTAMQEPDTIAIFAPHSVVSIAYSDLNTEKINKRKH